MQSNNVNLLPTEIQNFLNNIEIRENYKIDNFKFKNKIKYDNYKHKVIDVKNNGNCNFEVLANAANVQLNELKKLLLNNDDTKMYILSRYIYCYHIQETETKDEDKYFREMYYDNLEYNVFKKFFKYYKDINDDIYDKIQIYINKVNISGSGELFYTVPECITEIKNIIKQYINDQQINIIYNKIININNPSAIRFVIDIQLPIFFKNYKNIILFEFKRQIYSNTQNPEPHEHNDHSQKYDLIYGLDIYKSLSLIHI